MIRAQQSPQGAVDYALPVAQDAADPSPVVECNPPPGSLFPIGETEVTCTATDAANLVSAPVRFKVVVQQGAIPTKPGIAASVPKLTNRTRATFQPHAGAGRLGRVQPDTAGRKPAPCSAGTARTYTGLVEGARTCSRCRWRNAIGNVNQASYGWAVDLTSPEDVARFSARSGDRIVRLSWTKPIDVDYDHVRLWRKRAGATSWRRLADRAVAAAFLDREVSNHVRYVYRIRSFDLAGNVSAAATASAWPTPILSPAYDAIVHSPPLVDWRSVRNATYYNMQVWRNGGSLSVWPSGSQYRLRSSWTFQGRRHMLSGGRSPSTSGPGSGRRPRRTTGRCTARRGSRSGSCVRRSSRQVRPTASSETTILDDCGKRPRDGPLTTGNDWEGTNVEIRAGASAPTRPRPCDRGRRIDEPGVRNTALAQVPQEATATSGRTTPIQRSSSASGSTRCESTRLYSRRSPTRTTGTASPVFRAITPVDYVVETLEAAGYDPDGPDVRLPRVRGRRPLGLQQIAPNAVTYTEGVDFGPITQSDPGDVTAAVTAVDLQLGLGNTSTSGCEASTSRASPPGTSRCSSAASARSS